MNGLSVIGRIWDFILRAWETVAGFQHWNGSGKNKEECSGKWREKLWLGPQRQAKREPECGPAGSCPGSSFWFWSPVRLVTAPSQSLCDGPFGHSVASTALGTGPHTAANEIDYDPLCVDGDSWANKRVDKTVNLRKCCEENKAG